MPVDNKNPQQQKKVAPITINGIPQAVIDMVRDKHPDYDNVMGLGNQTTQGAPSGQIPAVAPQPMNMNVFQQNGGVSGKLEAPAVQTQEPDLTPSTPAPAPEYGTDGVQFTNPAQTQQNDLSALSSALNGSAAQQRQVPEFQADPSQRDGGFFGWLGKLIPKSRPGMREGETPDEYDRRITTNRERIAAFADAIRHMGNIVNTSKGAPLQVFNDPTTMMEQGYQKRKVQRQKQDALDADAAYKQANLSLKQRAAEVAEAYKQATLGYKQKAEERAEKNDEFNRNFKTAGLQRQLDNDKFNQAYKTASLEESVRSHKASEGLRAQSNAISSARLSLASAKFAYEQAQNSNDGGKSIKSLPTANGYITRNNDLSTIEKKAIWQWMDKKGWLTKEFKSDWDILTPQQRGEKINGAIAWAARQGGARGKMFLDLLQRSYRYKPVNASANNGSATVNNGKTGGAKPAGKSKNGYKNTKKLGL